MSTAGTNITSILKPAVGVTAGPTWATDLNTSIDAVDNHDHSTNKGVRITPAAINVNADMEFNQNSASELKNLIFDSAVTAATTSYSVYQASGNLYWRNGSGTAVQITTGSTVNAGAGSIDGMTGTDAGATYVNGAKAYNFFCDSGNTDFAKMVHADLLLYKFSDDNTADTDYITIVASALASGSSGTVTVPAETGTILTTNTSYAGAVINVATSASNYAINLKPHGTGHVVIGNAGATGKLTSNGAYDLILDTNSGTNSSSIAITDAANGSISFIPNGTGEIVIGSGSASAKVTSSGAHDLVLDTNAGSSSGSITIIDAANGNIDITPNGSGEVNISKVDINGGTLAAITIDGNWTAASQTCANLGTVTTTGTIGLGGKLTAGSTEIEGSNFDITGGSIVGTTIGTSSHTTGKFTTCDATTDFTIGGLVITDATITDNGTLTITATTGITLGIDTTLAAGKSLETSTTGKVYSKGNCLQTNFHSSLIFGY
jgi:hypothetical protein